MSTQESQLPHTPVGRALNVVIALAFLSGALGWVWLGEWRLAVTSLVVIVLAAVAAGQLDSLPRRRLRYAAGWCGTCGRPFDTL